MKIVIVSACSAGIASTYMAAEALELAAKKRGHEAHAETQGTLGIENEISPAIAQGADVVILATDVAIQKRERFAGKPILEVGVAEAIRHAEAVILRAEQVARG
jgi:fructose-specific phosphotransferase system IIB component